MTVNERLVALSLSDEFDQACRDGAVDRLRAILSRARIDDASIEQIIRTKMRSP